MAEENEISIEVTVNSQGQQQVEKYIKSFDSLRTSVNGLSQPFNSFSNNINYSIGFLYANWHTNQNQYYYIVCNSFSYP